MTRRAVEPGRARRFATGLPEATPAGEPPAWFSGDDRRLAP